MTNNIFYWFVYFVVIFYSTRLFLTCCFAAFTLRILYFICIIYVLKFAFNVLVYDILAKHAFLLCHDFSFRRPSKTPAEPLWWSTHYIYITTYTYICVYTGLVSSGASLTSWREGASLALVGHPSSDGITIKMPYGVDVLHWPASHPIFSYWVG